MPTTNNPGFLGDVGMILFQAFVSADDGCRPMIRNHRGRVDRRARVKGDVGPHGVPRLRRIRALSRTGAVPRGVCAALA